MQSIELRFYTDILSLWCYAGDLALERLEEAYGDRLRVDVRPAVLHEGGPLGYTPETMRFYFARMKQITGIELNPGWLRSADESTSHVNLAVEALRSLGHGEARVRRALARAALVDGKPMCDRAAVIAEASLITGADTAAIDAAMRNPQVAERVFQSSREFDRLGVDVRPAFVLRSPIGDGATLAGLHTFETLDALAREMLHALDGYEVFGPAPV